jgi:stage III sporulation protein SpoIIIAA
MEQLLDLLPAGLGQCLLQHPNRSQLIEVHTAPLLRCQLITLPRIFRAVTCHVPSHMTSASCANICINIASQHMQLLKQVVVWQCAGGA